MEGGRPTEAIDEVLRRVEGPWVSGVMGKEGGALEVEGGLGVDGPLEGLDAGV